MTQGYGGTGVLDGIAVVDLTTGHAGPVATSWLGELGADVVKVEPPGGDPLRRREPAAFATWNRNKRSVVLDLDDPADRARLDELLRGADVVVHDCSPGRAAALALDDAALARRHPQLLVASVAGSPHGHPDAELPAHELLVQARIGAMDELEARRPGPMFVRFPFAGWGAAYLLLSGILTQLFRRERTGAVEPLHTSLMQGALTVASLYWQRAERPPAWMAAHTLPRDDNPAQLTIFECADGRFLQLLGAFTRSAPIAELLTARGEAQRIGEWVTPATRRHWAAVLRTKTVDEWTALLWPHGVVCMPVLEMGAVLASEQARVNGYAVEIDDAVFGPTVQAACPIRVGGSPARATPAPTLGNTGVAGVLASSSGHPNGAAPSSPTLPFAGLRVVDFGSYVAGPFGAQCFADFGADVIKVEPCAGEKGRTINQFTGCHRGKRALALDLRHPVAREVLARLFAGADVVMHNMRERAAQRLGIDEAAVRAANPDVVYAHSSAYGTRGPWASFGGFDPTAFALSGWAVELSPGKLPTWFRPSAMDCHTGIALFAAAVAGLLARARTGVAPRVSTSLLAVAVATGGETLLAGPDQRPVPIRAVDADQTGVSDVVRIGRARGGWFAVAAEDEAQADVARKVFAEAPSGATVATIAGALDAAGVPATSVATDHRDALFDAELARGSRLVERTSTLDYGWFDSLGGYWHGRGGPVRSPGTIPAVGEHSRAVLQDLGFAAVEIDRLIADGAVAERVVAGG